MTRKLLTDTEIRRRLRSLNEGSKTGDWTLENHKLHKEFVFTSFAAAFGFMTKVALAAEAMDHHPEWFNVYKRVRVDLSTHSASGITRLDFELARKMEDFASY